MSSGKSLSLRQNAFVQPPDEDVVEDQDGSGIKRDKRFANVYDCVAGRANAHGFLSTQAYASKHRDTLSSTARSVRPEEVLFRRQRAPMRYEETDFYFAHESLPQDCPLPDSDFLTATHAYCADFYDRATVNRGRHDYRTMDETALIAMGVLLEEMAKESLGKTGDLVLVEGEDVEDGQLPHFQRAGSVGRKRANTDRQTHVLASIEDGADATTSNLAKRPKLSHQSSIEADTQANGP